MRGSKVGNQFTLSEKCGVFSEEAYVANRTFMPYSSGSNLESFEIVRISLPDP